MTFLSVVFWMFVLLAIAYVVTATLAIRKPRSFQYTTFPCDLFRHTLGRNGMVAITIWHRCYVFDEANVRFFGVGQHGRVHESTHMDQWDAHPYLFPVLYLAELARRGYGCNKYEEAARRAAGEPSECGRPQAAS